MKKLTWVTHTNISTKTRQDLNFDLTQFLAIFIKNELWNKKPYRTEYKEKYTKKCLEKITSINVNIHSDIAPYSNFHRYENILNKYIDLEKIEYSKIHSSGISEAFKIAVIEVQFDSDNKVIDYLTYEEEKDIDTVFGKKMSDENHKSWLELKKIKSIISEFVQFYIFNFHLNFLTHNYQFSFSDKPNLIGFTTVSENGNHYYETDKIDFLAHYFLYEKEHDKMLELMRVTSEFWHKEIPSIHFFLDALKGNNVTSTNFIKLVFTIESFFSKNSSNDFMSLTIPMLLSKNISESKSFRETLTKSFSKRNEIVHGNKLYDFSSYSDKESKDLADLFFKLKNLIIHLFYFYIDQKLYNNRQNEKINHEMIFRLFTNRINIKK